MSSRRWATAWRSGLALALALTVTACASGQGAKLAQGIVLTTHDAGPLKVDWFTLRERDGTILTIYVGALQVDAGSFDAPHLVVHQLTAAPVIVEYHVEDGRDVAFRLSDAPKAP